MRIDPSQAEALENARAERAGKRAKTSAAEVPQVTTENWATICAPDSSLLCAIAMLDPSAATFDADLKLAHAVAAGATAEPFSFMWADGTCELAFADAFDVQPPKLPTIVALSPKKRRFAGFVGGFEEAPVRQFLTGILTGRRKTSPISDIPLPEHTAEKCAELAAENAAAASADAEAGDDGELDDLMAEIRAEEEAAKKAQEVSSRPRPPLRRPRRTPRPRKRAKRARRRRRRACPTSRVGRVRGAAVSDPRRAVVGALSEQGAPAACAAASLLPARVPGVFGRASAQAGASGPLAREHAAVLPKDSRVECRCRPAARACCSFLGCRQLRARSKRFSHPCPVCAARFWGCAM